MMLNLGGNGYAVGVMCFNSRGRKNLVYKLKGFEVMPELFPNPFVLCWRIVVENVKDDTDCKYIAIKFHDDLKLSSLIEVMESMTKQLKRLEDG